ncbi:MAG: DNA-processing protein DprA [Stenotrophomonas nitritireducens]|uniref:DNA-processing protein DprA n=1 Tax=Stenotrophomonas nitritireducens TaxID=83617 RepID=UPI001AC9B67C|nr:DNA-processing protein DprA [Stenotrophomonas nitritireducens]MBN8792811.1 DNA-processing protein DprA [Stenotrophomonas nitritireducens]MBN8796405.1 DNA-processing protein DprA [Stenotrophomonas nitritireducens]
MPVLPDLADERGHEAEALLALVLAGGPARPLRDLLEHFGNARDTLAAGLSAWRAAGLGPQQMQALAVAAPGRMEQVRRWLDHPRHHLLGWRDPDYPPLLRSCPNPPVAVFVDGDPAQLWQPAIAIVGSRNPSAAGRDNAYEFASALSASGLCVGSGLAAGIDAAAHRAALDGGGSTFAVIGTGPDLAYPRRHAVLQEQIAAAGAVVSEYPPGTPARSGQFPSRNRLLAALCLGTVVIEAAERSGALITARLAAEAGREVFAMPGSIRNPMARGCHRLIRDGATLVTQPADILEGVANLAGELAGALQNRLSTPIPDAPGVPCPAPTLPDQDYQRLWNALGHDPTGMDSLIRCTGLTASRLSSMLLVMELEGKVSSAYGCYTRT